MQRCVDVMVGLQWGSEGKGKFAALVAKAYRAAVRVGGPNAGHTFYQAGKKYVCRSVPCAWINPNAELFIGAGAVIHLQTLADEIASLEVSGIGVADRIVIDPHAVFITDADIASERSLTYIGSTRHGIGAAIARKVRRSYRTQLLKDIATNGPNSHVYVSTSSDKPYRLRVAETAPILHRLISSHLPVFLEGTQGTLLSLDFGEYPYVTGRNVLAASLLSDCGIAPLHVRRVFGVMRTYPIRVAGTSGPMGLELSWEDIANRAGLAAPPNECTTVTKKIRRVAELTPDLLSYAARLNGCTDLMVAFLDYIDGRLSARTEVDFDLQLSHLIAEWPLVGERLAAYAAMANTPVSGASWGPHPDQSLLEAVQS